MKKRIALIAAAAFITVAAIIYLYATEDGAGAGIPCVIHMLTGFYCPGCGTARALRELLHLEFYKALRYNAIVTVAAPFLAFYFVSLAVSYIRFGKDRVSEKIPVLPLYIFIAVFVIYGVLRNIPEFSFLAPTAI